MKTVENHGKINHHQQRVNVFRRKFEFDFYVNFDRKKRRFDTVVLLINSFFLWDPTTQTRFRRSFSSSATSIVKKNNSKFLIISNLGYIRLDRLD